MLLEHGVHKALAENLYQSGALSLGQAARLANMSIAEFTEYLSQLGIPVVDVIYPASYDATRYSHNQKVGVIGTRIVSS